MKKPCTCWICSSTLRSILKKLKGKEKAFYEALIERYITAEDDAAYWKHRNGEMKEKLKAANVLAETIKQAGVSAEDVQDVAKAVLAYESQDKPQ